MHIEFILNDKPFRCEGESDTPLLWVIRDEAGLKGTKYGCGFGQCGACTVHVDGIAVRSCVLPAAAIVGKAVTTIEAIAADHKVKAAWVECQVPQCGYCQSGQIMSAVALIDSKKNLSDETIDEAMSGNICRCGTYGRIRSALHSLEDEK